MKLTTLALLPNAAALAIPFGGADVGSLFAAVDRWLNPDTRADDGPAAAIPWPIPGLCNIKATGGDDTTALTNAIKRCGRNGVITLPSERYIVKQPLSWYLTNAVVELHGVIEFDIAEPPEDVGPDPGDALKAVFDIKGPNWVFGGSQDKTGGIDISKANLGAPGRPAVALAVHQSSGSVVQRLKIVAPGGIGVSLDLATGTAIEDLHIDTEDSGATVKADQPSAGVVAFRTTGLAVSRLKYRGGGECVSVRPQSHGIAIEHLTCEGAGVGIGAVSAHPGQKEIITNVAIGHAHIKSTPEHPVENGVHLRSFALADSFDKHTGHDHPQGYATNISISRIDFDNVAHAVHLEGNLAEFAPSVFHWSHVNVTHLTGTTSTKRVARFDCSPASPCHHFKLNNWHVATPDDGEPEYVCNNVETLRGNVNCVPE